MPPVGWLCGWRTLVSRDQIFARVILGLFSILVLYGLGMTLVIVLGDVTLGGRMVTGFSGMFAGILGFLTGYLLAKPGNGQGNGDPPKKPE